MCTLGTVSITPLKFLRRKKNLKYCFLVSPSGPPQKQSELLIRVPHRWPACSLKYSPWTSHSLAFCQSAARPSRRIGEYVQRKPRTEAEMLLQNKGCIWKTLRVFKYIICFVSPAINYPDWHSQCLLLCCLNNNICVMGSEQYILCAFKPIIILHRFMLK